MANFLHPKSSDHEIPRMPGQSPLAESTMRNDAQDNRRRRTRIVLIAAILGTVLLLAAISGLIEPANRLAGVAASVSGALPTQAASRAEAPYSNGPTGYFPDQFVVKRWDERPAPEQF